MKKYFGSIIAVLLLAALVFAGSLASRDARASSGDVNVADFGAVPNDGLDDAAAIRSAIQYAKDNNRARLLFSAGRYDLKTNIGTLYSASDLTENDYFLKVDTMTDFTVEGAVDGSGNPTTQLVRQNPAVNDVWLAPLLVVHDCTNITIKNLVFDNDPYYYSAGTVVEKTSTYVVVEVFENHPRIAGMAAFQMGRYDIANRRLINGMLTGASSAGNWTLVSGGEGRRMQLNNSTVAGMTSVGEGLYWYFSYNGGGHQVHLEGNTNLTLDNLKVLNSTGFNFWAGNGVNLTIHDVKIIPEGNRIMVSPRDGFKIMRQTGFVDIDGLWVEGTNDDGQNLHGTFIWVNSVPSSNRVIFDTMMWGNAILRVGGTMGFWNGASISHIGTITAASINGSSQYVVDFQETVPAWVGYHTMVTPYDTIPTSYTLRNSTFKNIYGSGPQNRGENVLIENNNFINLSNPGVFLSSGINDCDEASAATNVEVRNNTFTNTGWRAGWLGGDPAGLSTDATGATGLYLKNIKIHDNVFQNMPYTGIYVRDANNVWIYNNTFTSVPTNIVVDRTSTGNVFWNAPDARASMSKSGWIVTYVDSVEPDSPAAYAIDENLNTAWHTKFTGGVDPLPHDIWIDMGASHTIDAFRYMPRQDGGANGTIGQYEFYVSTDGTNWGSPVASGTWADDISEKTVTFTAQTVRYIRLRALTEAGGRGAWSSAAEISVLEVGGPTATPFITPTPAPTLTPTATPVGQPHTFSTEFSSTQGQNNWYYQYYNGSYSAMTWNSTNNQWVGNETYVLIQNGQMHPGEAADAALKWVPSANGTLRIIGTASDANSGGGDGVFVKILKNSTVLWSATVANGDTTGQSHDVSTSVTTSDVIYFITNKNSANNWYDLTNWNPTIWVDALIPTPTNTSTPTNTPTNTPTRTATPTNTATPSNSGWVVPGANAAATGGDGNGFQTNPANAYSDNATFAVDTDSGTNTNTSCSNTGKDRHVFYTYNLSSVPSGATILGLEVQLQMKVDSTTGSPKSCIELSWDGGATWTAAKTSSTFTKTEASYTLGGAADTWGHAWTRAELSNLRVRITNVASNTSRDFSLDWIPVRVTYR